MEELDPFQPAASRPQGAAGPAQGVRAGKLPSETCTQALGPCRQRRAGKVVSFRRAAGPIGLRTTRSICMPPAIPERETPSHPAVSECTILGPRRLRPPQTGGGVSGMSTPSRTGPRGIPPAELSATCPTLTDARRVRGDMRRRVDSRCDRSALWRPQSQYRIGGVPCQWRRAWDVYVSA